MNNLVDFNEFRRNKLIIGINKIAYDEKTPTRLLLQLGRAKLALLRGEIAACEAIIKSVKQSKKVFIEVGHE